MKTQKGSILTATAIVAGFCLIITLGIIGFGKLKGTNSGWFDNYEDRTQYKEVEITEQNQKKMLEAVPVPSISTSQERKNLVKRLERFNTENKISYIYLVNYGKVMAFYTVKGKVSSVNSLLTTPDQLVDDPHGSYDSGSRIVSSPDIDGSYGSNGDAIFFFTSDDIYVEWMGDYMLADEPLQLSTPPELVRNID